MQACSCETLAHGEFGPITDVERLVRVLTEKHFKPNGTLKPTAFSLEDIRYAGVSLIRAGFTDVAEFQHVAEDIRRSASAVEVRGALVAEARHIRELKDVNDRREMCVKDDPVISDRGLRDNPAHAVTLSTASIGEIDAKDIRARLLEVFSEARYLGEVWHG